MKSIPSVLIIIIITNLILINYSLTASITFPVIEMDDNEFNDSNIEIESSTSIFNSNPMLQSTLRNTASIDAALDPQTNNRLYVPISIGNPPQIIPLRLSTKDQYIWVAKEKGYDLSLSSTAKNSTETLRIETMQLYGVLTQDDIQISNTKINDFSFLVIYSETKIDDLGIIGLGKTEKKYEHLNFIDTLYIRQLISRKVFYLSLLDNDNKGHSLVIGEYPSYVESKENRNYFHQHKLIYPIAKNGLNKIATRLSAVFIEGDTKLWDVNDLVSFSYGSNFILVSWAFYDHLRDNFFRTEIESGICKVKETTSYEYIVCATTKFGPREAINFILGDWTYKFNYNEYLLKRDDNDTAERMIAFIKNKFYNGWSFGYHFYKKYLTVFDIQQDKIGIYYHP